MKIDEQESYILHNRELIENSKKLVEEIKAIKITEKPNEKGYVSSENPQIETVHMMAQSYMRAENPVKNDIDTERDNIRRWLRADVDDDFFDCGELKARIQLFGGSEIYIGSDAEKLKYDKLTELFYYLAQLDIRSMYIETFSGMSFIPLAIQNISSTDDQNIRVVVRVLNGEIINPEKDLICDELDGIQGHICRNEDENEGVGIIDELFILPKDGIVHTEEAANDPSSYRIKTPVLIDGRLQYLGKDEQDYEDELREYIATSAGPGYYEFEVESLRPNECKWLSQGLLVKLGRGI